MKQNSFIKIVTVYPMFQTLQTLLKIFGKSDELEELREFFYNIIIALGKIEKLKVSKNKNHSLLDSREQISRLIILIIEEYRC